MAEHTNYFTPLLNMGLLPENISPRKHIHITDGVYWVGLQCASVVSPLIRWFSTFQNCLLHPEKCLVQNTSLLQTYRFDGKFIFRNYIALFKHVFRQPYYLSFSATTCMCGHNYCYQDSLVIL